MADPVATPYGPPSPNNPPITPTPGGPFPTGGSFGATKTGGPPDWIIFGMGLLIVGGVAEVLTNINKKAGIMFALLIVLGYAATGGKLDNAIKFLTDIGVIIGV